MFHLSYSSKCIILLTSSGGKVDLVSGRIKDLKEGHQPFDKSESEASLSANYSQNDCVVSRISFTTLLRMVLNFCQSLSKFNLFAFLYARLRV